MDGLSVGRERQALAGNMRLHGFGSVKDFSETGAGPGGDQLGNSIGGLPERVG